VVVVVDVVESAVVVVDGLVTIMTRRTAVWWPGGFGQGLDASPTKRGLPTAHPGGVGQGFE
jgi:hypothetical protein